MISVLLVDDNPSDAFLVERRLSREIPDVSVTAVASAREAIDEIAQQLLSGAPLPSIIVSDIKLPGMSGDELVRTLRESDYLSGVPILGHSAMQDPALIAGFLSAGGDEVVFKEEYARDQLAERVRAHCPAPTLCEVAPSTVSVR